MNLNKDMPTEKQMIAEWLKTNTPKKDDLTDYEISKEKNVKKILRAYERRAASGR